MNCIETNNLSYQYSKKETVLNNINLNVPTGSFYGFLGKNGSGKTTTLKLLLGLLKNQQGDIHIFNKDIASNRIEILKNVGSLIESPSFYAHLTAKDNLTILQKIYQCSKSRIEEVLKIVGLSETKNKKVSEFSLGMKQRLSIGIAILHNPKLLIFDEPTNGLDPNGIIDIRDLLKKINTELGVTIVISSHMLSEIEKMVSHLGIINNGNMIFQGTLNELKLKQIQSSNITFETNDTNRAFEIISTHNIVPVIIDHQIIVPFLDNETVSYLNKQFVNNNIKVYQISTQQKDLESIFINLIKN